MSAVSGSGRYKPAAAVFRRDTAAEFLVRRTLLLLSIRRAGGARLCARLARAGDGDACAVSEATRTSSSTGEVYACDETRGDGRHQRRLRPPLEGTGTT